MKQGDEFRHLVYYYFKMENIYKNSRFLFKLLI
jgi:hypothetical protein